MSTKKDQKKSKHSLISECDDHFMLHDGGYAFPVPKSGLGDVLLIKIRSLPKYAEGGEVEPLDIEKVSEETPVKDIDLAAAPRGSDENPIDVELPEAPIKAESSGESLPINVDSSADLIKDVPQSTPAPQPSQPFNLYSMIPGVDTLPATKAESSAIPTQAAPSVAQPTAPKAAVVPQEQQVRAPAQQEQQAASPYDTAYQNYLKGFGLESAGIQKEAEAKAQLGQTIAKAYEEERKHLEAEKQRFEQNYNELKQQNEKLFQDVKDSKIDPNNYWNSMTTGGKITAAISLVLGGLAGGLQRTGQNAALDVIQKNIDRDIDAQKANLNKKDSLLKRNFEQIGDLRAAEALTRSQLMSITAAQVEKAKGMASTPAAQGAAAQLQGQLMEKMAQSGLQFSALNAKSQLASGNGRGVNPEYLDKETRERLVQLPSGRQALGYTPEDAKVIKEQFASLDPILTSLDKLDQIGTAALVPGSAAEAKARAIQAQLVPLINENAGLKRLSEEDIHNIRNMINDPTQFRNLLGGKAKSEEFRQFVEDKLQSTLKNRLEGYKTPFKPKTAKPYQGR